MNQLRLEADESSAKVEELQSKVKVLEQENLSKEQEITSLQHRNNLLETTVEKLETAIKDLKTAADEGQQHGTENESLTRRLQLLEEEAESADKTLREANEKYVATAAFDLRLGLKSYTKREDNALLTHCGYHAGFARLTSRLVTSSEKCRLLRLNESNGSQSTRRWRRSTTQCRRSWRSSRQRLATSEQVGSRWPLLCGTSCGLWMETRYPAWSRSVEQLSILRMIHFLVGQARCHSNVGARLSHAQVVHI
jgi:chromosome segregation ATPase